MTTLPSKDFNQGPGISAVRNDERPAFPPTVKGQESKLKVSPPAPSPEGQIECKHCQSVVGQQINK